MVAKPLIVIVGVTASGKSSLAMEIARRFGGEIICADSRTVYKGMDIGTAKPPVHDRKDIQHHLLDVVEPSEHFSAAKFKELALEAIEDIEYREKLPILVGGTGLYVDSLIFDYAFLPTANSGIREELEQLSIEQLQTRLSQESIPLPANSKNKRHLIRAIETNGQVPVRKSFRPNTLVVGIEVSRQETSARIEARIAEMIEQGLESEVAELIEQYGTANVPGFTAVGYREWLNGDSQEIVIQKITSATMQYAKRQRTWFRRNEHIKWVNKKSDAIKLVQDFLVEDN